MSLCLCICVLVSFWNMLRALEAELWANLQSMGAFPAELVFTMTTSLLTHLLTLKLCLLKHKTNLFLTLSALALLPWQELLPVQFLPLAHSMKMRKGGRMMMARDEEGGNGHAKDHPRLVWERHHQPPVWCLCTSLHHMAQNLLQHWCHWCHRQEVSLALNPLLEFFNWQMIHDKHKTKYKLRSTMIKTQHFYKKMETKRYDRRRRSCRNKCHKIKQKTPAMSRKNAASEAGSPVISLNSSAMVLREVLDVWKGLDSVYR
jgi:hypothetical protein